MGYKAKAEEMEKEGIWKQIGHSEAINFILCEEKHRLLYYFNLYKKN